MADVVFDKEAYRQYIDDVNDSHGFYISSNYGYNLRGGIVKIDKKDIVRYQGAEKAAMFAIDEYNNKEKTNKLKYLRIINLNMETFVGAMYYVTFEAVELLSGDIHHYQAKVWETVSKEFRVKMFRLAPYAMKHIETYDEEHDCLWIGNLQPEMDEYYLYYKCFRRVYKLVSVKVIRDEESGDSKGYGFLYFETLSATKEVLNDYNGTLMPNSTKCFNLNREI